MTSCRNLNVLLKEKLWKIKKIKRTRRSDAKSFPKIKFKYNYFITSPNAGTPLDQQQNGRT